MLVAEDEDASDLGFHGSDGRRDVEGAHAGRDRLVGSEDVVQILEALCSSGVLTCFSTDFGDYNIGKEVPQCFKMETMAHQSTIRKGFAGCRIQFVRSKFFQETFKKLPG